MDKSKYDILKLENQLCFPLYAVSKEIIKRYNPILEKLSLTYTQYIAMLVLWQHGSVSVKELGKRLFLDSGTLTPVLKSLEKKGYIIKTRLKKDERVVVASLTVAGEKLKDEAITVPQEIASCMNLEENEVSSLYDTLYKILASN